jgi:hypothetical protein
MLQEGCVSERLLMLCRKLEGEPAFNGYFLVGGTALALQLGHRKSDDIDLFTQNELQIPEITKYLIQNHGNKFQIVNSQHMIFQVIIDGIKVDFIHHPFMLVEAPFHDNQIKYLGKKDIAAMKLHAIETDGSRAKDFVDIFFLLDEIPLENMFRHYQKKYATGNIFNAKRSLGYFNDVPEESWKEVRFIKRQISANTIKRKIINAIQKYNDKADISNPI